MSLWLVVVVVITTAVAVVTVGAVVVVAIGAEAVKELRLLYDQCTCCFIATK
jgi:3-keto-L-gulonate-6-phosphate decarboxylase